jgi:hypothetical protein
LDAETAIQVFFVYSKGKPVPNKGTLARTDKPIIGSDSFDGFFKALGVSNPYLLSR